ncbi:MAG TPA: hypothetical protein VF755_06070 [Catenuloplanes sp.]
MTTLASGLVGLAGTGGAAAVAVAMARRGRPYLAGSHALGTARRPFPLPDALRRGFAGATVAVRPGPRGELYVGSGEPVPGHTLRRLVLQPLNARITKQGGRLYRAQRAPFNLLLDFVGPDRDAETLGRAYRCLDGQLRDHAGILTGYLAGRVRVGPVAVTVAGILDARGLLATQRERYAFAEGTFDDIGSSAAPATLVPTVGEPWSWRFGWDGQDDICAEERHLLHGLVREAHADGRTVRIGAVPARSRKLRPAFWRELTTAGVDAIADPDLPGLARYLRSSRPGRLADGRGGHAYAKIVR